ncbi:MAG: T9SS type A sorting domain-containing protein, partial [Ignavibacteriae bacterium]|nr:T9SS type A sorting domain-containing protein [Ignavibacteriota bacterium]
RQGAEYEYRLISIEKDGRRVVAARGRVLVTGGAESSYSLSVYPNPASEYSRISWRAPRGVASSLLMVDAEGKVVREEELSVDGTGELRIDVTQLSSGVYHLRLVSGDEVLTQTLTVQK